MKKISLIIPCYNEEESLKYLYKELEKVSSEMLSFDFEYIFVDDGSKDKTLELLKELAAYDRKTTYISFSRNFGKEAAMYAGLCNATGDYVAIMDADLQDPPEMLIEMYKGIKDENYDCVGLYTKSHKGYSMFRKALTKLWYKIINKISPTPQVPGARDYRLMKRRMVESILEMNEYNRYIKGIFSYVGFDTKWIEYEAPDRELGTSKFTFRKLIRYAVEGMVSFSTKPLVFSVYLGLTFCLISFIYLIYTIIKTLIVGNGVSGWPTLVCLITFLGGLQLFFLGIIGLYIAKIYLEVKKRPTYIIKETEKDM